MVIYLGIDPGVNGGIAAINDKQEIVLLEVMPVVGKSKKEYDLYTFINLIKALQDMGRVIAVTEKAQPRFSDGTKQSFKTGFGFGMNQSVLSSFSISYEVVAPKVWQKEIFQGNVEDTKQASIMFCKKKFPNIDLKANDRCKKDHDGKADALAIASFCYRINTK